MKRVRNKVLLAVLLGFLGAMIGACFEPIDHGYIRYTAIAEAMVRTGDWIIPRHAGEIYVLKPPLFVWITALPIAALHGVPRFASHLAPTIGSICALLAAFRITSRVHGSWRAGALAALILLTMPEFATELRGERIDPLFGGLFALAMDAIHESYQRGVNGRSRFSSSLRAGILLGLAVLTKGPFAIIFVALCLIPFHYLQRRANNTAPGLSWVPFALTLAVVVLPWPIEFVSRLGWKAAIESVEDADFATRHAPPWVYLISLPIVIGPWIGLLPALALRVRRWWVTIDCFTFCWFVGPFVAIHFSSVRHVRYLAPLLPALAVLLAGVVYGVAYDPVSRISVRWIGRLIGVLAGLAALAGFAGVIVNGSGLRTWLDAGMNVTPVAILFASGALALLARRLRRMTEREYAGADGKRAKNCARRMTFAIALVTLVVFAARDVLDAERFALWDSTASIERTLQSSPAGDELIGLGLEPHEVDTITCVGRREVVECEAPQDLLQLLKSHGSRTVVSRRKDWERLRNESSLTISELGSFTAWKDRDYVVGNVGVIGT